MSNTQIITKEIYKVDENGQTVLVETIEIEVNEPTQEEIIAEKQAELLKIYAEIQALKTN
jgi:preprotein translocase subunit SecA